MPAYAQRVVPCVHVDEGSLVEVSVDLSCGNVRVPEKLLHRTKIRSVLNEMCAERMPEYVRLNIFLDPAHTRVFLYLLPYPLSAERVAAKVEKVRVGANLLQKARPHLFAVPLEQLTRAPAKGYDTLFFPFSVHANPSVTQMYIACFHRAYFRDPQTAGVHEFYDRAISQAEITSSKTAR